MRDVQITLSNIGWFYCKGVSTSAISICVIKVTVILQASSAFLSLLFANIYSFEKHLRRECTHTNIIHLSTGYITLISIVNEILSCVYLLSNSVGVVKRATDTLRIIVDPSVASRRNLMNNTKDDCIHRPWRLKFLMGNFLTYFVK